MIEEDKFKFSELISKAEETATLTQTELISLLNCDSINSLIFDAADKIRKKYVGDEVHLRALIEFSNYCKNNCLYCGIRKDNKKITRYRLSERQIIDLARKAKELGYQTVVLQSGEDPFYDINKMQIIIREIKSLDLAITLSIGEKSLKEYEAYKIAGADRFLLRIETTDQNLYHSLDPEMYWQNRRKCLDFLKNTNYEVGTGSLIGLPGQTIESLADDILFFKEIGADMIGIGPFIPHPDTPLANQNKGNLLLSLKVMALTRILLRDINIPATTAMETLGKNAKILALKCGANVIMPNITEENFGKFYDLYPGKTTYKPPSIEYQKDLEQELNKIGRTIGKGKGSHKKQTKI